MRLHIRKAALLLFLIFTFLTPWLRAQTRQPVQAQVDSLNKLFNETYYSDLAGAEKLATEALKLSVQSGYLFGEANAYSNLSVVYQKKENNTKAIEAGFTALKIYDKEEKFKKTFEYGNTLIRLAKAFFMEQDSGRSAAYGHQAIVLAQNIHDAQLLALGYESLGNNYASALQIDSALYYYNMAKSGYIKTSYSKGLANLANNTGAMYSRNGDNQKAIPYFKEALAFYRQNNQEASFTIIHFNIALCYYQLKSYNNALQHLDSAGYYAQKFKRLATLLDIYAQKARSYQGLGNLDSSASYFEKTLSLKDTINNDTYRKELATLQTQSDVYKTETENKLLIKDKRIAVLYRNLAIAGIVGLAVVLGFFLVTQRLRIHRRVKDKLEEEVALRTKEIFRQKETIFHTNLRLKLALNGAKLDGRFAFKMLNAIQQVVLQKSPQEAQEHLAKLSHLMQYVLEKSPLERVALSEELEMIERYIQLEQLQQGHRFDYTITVNADEQTPIPALLLYSYVEDAIINGLTPASGENLHLQLHLQRANDLLTVTIVYNNASRKKVKPNNNNSQGGTIGKEILTLLTHLTHKNHLQQIEDQVTGMEDYIVTKVTLRIPIEGRPGIPTVAPEDDVFEIGD